MGCHSQTRTRFYSFELYNINDKNNLHSTICIRLYALRTSRFFNETSECGPIFYSLTWHEKLKDDVDIQNFPSLIDAEKFPSNTLIHLAAKGLYEHQAEAILKQILSYGIKNIFALQGGILCLFSCSVTKL